MSYEQRGDIDDSGDRFSPAFKSFHERECRPGSSVQYALELIAAEKDPYHLDTDLTTTSAVLQRLTIGPYSGGNIQDRHDMPGAYHSPKTKSPKPRQIAQKQDNSFICEACGVETAPLPTEVSAGYEVAGIDAAVDISTDDGFIYEDVEEGPAELTFESNELANELSSENELTPLITDFEISTPELRLQEGTSGQVSPANKEHSSLLEEASSEPTVEENDSALVNDQPETLSVMSTKDVVTPQKELLPVALSTKESLAESNDVPEIIPESVEPAESGEYPNAGADRGYGHEDLQTDDIAEKLQADSNGGGGCCVLM